MNKEKSEFHIVSDAIESIINGWLSQYYEVKKIEGNIKTQEHKIRQELKGLDNIDKIIKTFKEISDILILNGYNMHYPDFVCEDKKDRDNIIYVEVASSDDKDNFKKGLAKKKQKRVLRILTYMGYRCYFWRNRHFEIPLPEEIGEGSEILTSGDMISEIELTEKDKEELKKLFKKAGKTIEEKKPQGIGYFKYEYDLDTNKIV